MGALLASALFVGQAVKADELALEPGDRIALVGNALAERLQHDGWFETYLQATHPEHKLVVRNLGYSGDQVHYRPRAHEGFGNSDSHLANVQASVIFAFFGYNESFADKPEDYRKQLAGWIDHVRTLTYLPGGKKPRIVLFSPIAHEDLGNPLLPDGKENNARLAAIARVTAEVAKDK
ncbi:MAG TPA: dehydrogenase, partial [Bacteroidia bacterium]|nr:dehydrogenase [Bacteroidia bacterium]